jgi:hypothetical protein
VGNSSTPLLPSVLAGLHLGADPDGLEDLKFKLPHQPREASPRWGPWDWLRSSKFAFMHPQLCRS